MADMLGSIGVIAAALIIKFTGWSIVDPILAVLIGLWVRPRTGILILQAGNILMQVVPDGIDLEAVRKTLVEFPGVVEQLRRDLARMLEERFGIEDATLQVEAVPCGGHEMHV